MRARLELQDGSVFEGVAFGSKSSSAGEVVFNTAMVGYPESLTDPSFRGQILTFTYPLVGNYGVNKPSQDAFGFPDRFESESIHVKGVILSSPPQDASHWNAFQSLDAWLAQHKVPGIYGIDTRALTKRLREHGVMLGRILIGDDVPEFYDPNNADLVGEVSCKELSVIGSGDVTIAVMDCGIKLSILRAIAKRGVRVLRVPHEYDLSKEQFDGLFISNGPGDPARMETSVKIIQAVMESKRPIFGICLGNQLLGRAFGAKTYKLKYGHRSHNQPCIDTVTKRCYITSQNHGFAVDESTLPSDVKPWFVNANDNTNEGLVHDSLPISSVQFHPESRGGPLDTGWLFDRFIAQVRKHKGLV